MKNNKKVKTLNDIKNDSRVKDIYQDDSTGEKVWWLYLEDGLVSTWDGCGTITSEGSLKYIKDTLNTENIVMTEDEYKIK